MLFLREQRGNSPREKGSHQVKSAPENCVANAPLWNDTQICIFSSGILLNERRETATAKGFWYSRAISQSVRSLSRIKALVFCSEKSEFLFSGFPGSSRD